jgi:flagellar basal body-associated protein FliL
MAEEPKAAPPPPKKKSGSIKHIVVIVVLVVLSVAGGVVLYKLVLAPKLLTSEEAPQEEAASEAIPPGAVPLDFEETQTAVADSNPNAANSVLIYTVSVICANAETKELVEKNKQWFVAMLSDLHRNRTKEELADPAVEKSILEQAREQANSLLARLQPEPNPEVKIIQVLHLKFTVFSI